MTTSSTTTTTTTTTTSSTSTDIENSDLIDWTIFSELIAMDEDEEGFSEGLVKTFVDQAMGIYDEIETIIDKAKADPQDEELVKLSSLGHYLKGSAAALGLKKIAQQCERIQNYGNKIVGKNEVLKIDDTKNSEWLDLIQNALAISKLEFVNTKKVLSDYFGESL